MPACSETDPPDAVRAQPARWRFALLMFLQYAPAGAVLPLFSLHLRKLDFTPLEIAQTCATQAIATLGAPLFAGQVADRWFPAERCLAVCAFVSGLMLLLLANLTAPVPVFWVSLAFWLAMAPALTLGTSLSFAHLERPARDFGRVRAWGTVGWVVASWSLGFWLTGAAVAPEWAREFFPPLTQKGLPQAFQLGGVMAFLYAAYALTLPHTPPQRVPRAVLAPVAAFRLLRERSFAVYCLVCLGWSITAPFATQINPLLFNAAGIDHPWLTVTLSIAQASEITALALLPMILLRLGERGTMRLGLFVWTLYMFALAQGSPIILPIIGLLGNGICICCFLVAGQVYINTRARGDIRVSAQSLLTCLTGIGMLLGNLLVGWVREAVGGAFSPTYAVAAGISVVLFAVFYVGFQGDEVLEETEQPSVPEVVHPIAKGISGTTSGERPA
jgi:MFS family permease